jgi:hypothetical protein
LSITSFSNFFPQKKHFFELFFISKSFYLLLRPGDVKTAAFATGLPFTAGPGPGVTALATATFLANGIN